VFIATAPVIEAACALTADGLAATLLPDACDPLAAPLETGGEGEHGRAAERDGDVPPDRRRGEHRALGGGPGGDAVG